MLGAFGDGHYRQGCCFARFDIIKVFPLLFGVIVLSWDVVSLKIKAQSKDSRSGGMKELQRCGPACFGAAVKVGKHVHFMLK